MARSRNRHSQIADSQFRRLPRESGHLNTSQMGSRRNKKARWGLSASLAVSRAQARPNSPAGSGLGKKRTLACNESDRGGREAEIPRRESVLTCPWSSSQESCRKRRKGGVCYEQHSRPTGRANSPYTQENLRDPRGADHACLARSPNGRHQPTYP